MALPFSNVNYDQYLLGKIVTSTYAKKKISIFLIMITSSLLKFILYSIFCYFISFNIYFDFIVHIIISVLLSLKSHIIYGFLKRFEHEFYLCTRYLINNYTLENFRKWKRNIVVTICFIFVIYLLFNEVTSTLLIVYVSQYGISFIIVDQIEQRTFRKIIYNIRNKPTCTFYDDINVIDLYYDIKINNQPSEPSVSPLVNNGIQSAIDTPLDEPPESNNKNDKPEQLKKPNINVIELYYKLN